MLGNYVIDQTDGITAVRFTKSPSEDDLFSAIDEVAENYMSDLRLWDFSSEGWNVSRKQIASLARYGAVIFPSPSKVAVFAPEDLSFGLARMYEIKAEKKMGVQFRVFRIEQEARSWLKG